MPSSHDNSSATLHEKVTQQRTDELNQLRARVNGISGGGPAANPVTEVLQRVSSYWWLELLAGIAWIVISVVVLKFNHASVTTVGILTGIMFLAFGAEEFLLASIDRRGRWLWAIFGVMLTVSGIVAVVHPVSTFARLADILGFVFLLIGVVWIIQAFAQRVFNELWWLQLISGILMVGMAFWVSGQFYLTRAATLLVFAGIWAMMKGITDVIRAFQIREVGQTLDQLPH
jgi:uncharacterized membrane protein HdeD (DUF308 family)